VTTADRILGCRFCVAAANSSLKTWALRKLGNDISDDAIIGPASSSAVAGSASAKAR
jgi:hypothetical protein